MMLPIDNMRLKISILFLALLWLMSACNFPLASPVAGGLKPKLVVRASQRHDDCNTLPTYPAYRDLFPHRHANPSNPNASTAGT